MINIGIDIGSTTTKCIILENEKITQSLIFATHPDSKITIKKLNSFILKQKISKNKLRIVTTGYGRTLFKSSKNITEIAAAGRGAYYLNNKKACLVIDIGGQDTKIISVNKNGSVSDFLMNDKCAAGTGRFLELMSKTLHLPLEEMSVLAKKSKKSILINSTCSVFAESEIISLINKKTNRTDICAAIFDSIAIRVAAMAKKVDQLNQIIFCGGGARSAALKIALEKHIDADILIPVNPQLVAAYGAALITD